MLSATNRIRSLEKASNTSAVGNTKCVAITNLKPKPKSNVNHDSDPKTDNTYIGYLPLLSRE